MLLFGGTWNTLGRWARKAIGHFKWYFMGHPSTNMEDGGAEGDLLCGDLTLEVSEEKNVRM